MSWIIYKHTNKINGKCYIGQTRQDPKDRWDNGNGYTHNWYFYNAIQKYGWDAFVHEIIEDNIVTQAEANKREIYWIEKYRTYVGFIDCNGYNLTKGGENHEHLGKSIYQIDMETLKIINTFPTTRLAEQETGIDHSLIIRCCKKAKRTVSAGNYYWCYVNDYNTWAPNKKKDKTISPMGKEVYQIDMSTLKVIAKFSSTKDVERKCNISAGNISLCCNRKKYSANGYFWCFGSDWNNKWKPKKNEIVKSVCRIDLITGETILFDTIALAAKESNIPCSETISRCCNGKQNTAGGYFWKYVE